MRINLTYDEVVENLPEAFDHFLKKKDVSTAKNALAPLSEFNFTIEYASMGRAFSFAEVLAGAGLEPVDNSFEARFERICGVSIQAARKQLWWAFPIDKKNAFVERKLCENMLAQDKIAEARQAEMAEKTEEELIEEFRRGGGIVGRMRF